MLLAALVMCDTMTESLMFYRSKPKYAHHFEPNRFVTVFLYLNDCPEGGETVFPYSKERLVTGINRDGMAECSDGLAVPPTKLRASMFYSQTPENDVDPSSLHGGCPPAKGIKCASFLSTYLSLVDLSR